MRTLSIAGAVIAMDQLTKTLAASGVLHGPLVLASTNPDLALGLAGAAPHVELAAGLFLLGLSTRVLRPAGPGWRAALGAGLVFGGCVGNLIDRALIGSVRDFIAGPGIVYNLADVALLAGLACCGLLRNGATRRAG